jgi:hypothetical protein
MSKIDELRSLMRGAARRASDGLGKLNALAEARRVLRELAKQRLLVPEGALGAAVARATGATDASVRARDGALWVDVHFDDGEHLEACFEPGTPTFAPRGPKELVWNVSPSESWRSRHLLDVASALSTGVAHALWAVVLPRELSDLGPAIVDRDGADRIRVDLRTVPAVRELSGQAGAAIIEVLELSSIECEDGELRLQLKLPGLG